MGSMGVWSILISHERSRMIMLVRNDFAKDKGRFSDPDCDGMWNDADSVGSTPHRIPTPGELPDRNSVKKAARDQEEGENGYGFRKLFESTLSIIESLVDGIRRTIHVKKITAMDKKTSDLANHLIQIARASEGNPLISKESLSSPLEAFGMTLGALRRRKEISLCELQELTGIEEETLLRIEVGRASLKQVIESLPSLAAAFGVEEKKLSRLLALAAFE
jgi:hypothetical protein